MIKNMVRISRNKFQSKIFISHRIGKGIYIWKSTGDFYEGDFSNDKRTGFGTLTVKTEDGKFQRQYAGGWKNDKKHVNLIRFYFILDKLFSRRVMVIYSFRMLNIMKENFMLINEMVGEECFMQMDQRMKDNGSMINDMEQEC